MSVKPVCPLRLLPALMVAFLLSGCAGLQLPGIQPEPPPVSAAQHVDEEGLYLRLIAELLEDNKPHAALAYLDAIPADQARQPRVQLMRAEVLRRLSRFAEASLLYAGLSESDLAGQAWRGLGLIEAAKGDLDVATRWLDRARDRVPTDPRVRNDLGYALMLQGELDLARRELATAIELGDERRAPRNLVLLLLVEGDDGSAEKLARRHLEPGALEPMRLRARKLRALLSPAPGPARMAPPNAPPLHGPELDPTPTPGGA